MIRRYGVRCIGRWITRIKISDMHDKPKYDPLRKIETECETKQLLKDIKEQIDLHYKWAKIIAAKHYGGVQAEFTPAELQELVNDLSAQQNRIALMDELIRCQDRYTYLLQRSGVSEGKLQELLKRIETSKNTLGL